MFTRGTCGRKGLAPRTCEVVAPGIEGQRVRHIEKLHRDSQCSQLATSYLVRAAGRR